MTAPKISIIIPMYNRKHYIAQALDSVFAQTFQDFEIIVRDDGSTDGSADFVQKKYAAEISSGKLKLRRNEKNIGEFPTDNKLLREAAGQYIMILHSDDMYFPQAFEQMYTLAELFNADVVHCSTYFTTAPDGVIKDEESLTKVYYDKNRVDTTEIVFNDPSLRFSEWYNGGIGIDSQHNIFRRKFLTENDLRFHKFGGNRFFALKWIMKAKILVKTPEPIYVYRNSPDSVTKEKFPPERVEDFISQEIKFSRHLDEFFAGDDFFKNNPEIQYLARSHLFMIYDGYRIITNKVYKNGITPELHRAVENAFKKHFGDDAALPIFLFHWIHSAMFNQPVDMLVAPPYSKN